MAPTPPPIGANLPKVSLDPITKRPVPVNPLVTKTPQEKLLFQQGEANYNLKKAESKMALKKQTPNDEESDLIHALWLRQLDYHGMPLIPLPYIPLINPRSKYPCAQTRQRDLDGLHRDPECCYHAAAVP